MDDTKKSIEYLRKVLDRLDADIIQAIEDRRVVAEELGTLKGNKNITNADQFLRRRTMYWERLGYFGAQIYTMLHTESSKLQKK